MESDNRNAPAFSQHPGIQIDGPPTDWLGLTKREWFAGQAYPELLRIVLAGMATQPWAIDADAFDTAAQKAVQAADALISALETKP